MKSSRQGERFVTQAARLEDRIAESYTDLSAKLKDAADFVVANQMDVAARSLRSVSAASGVSPATLSRLARSLRGGVPLERAILRVFDNLPLYRQAHRLVRDWHADVIYERYALTALAGSWVARRTGVPHILEVNAPLADEEARYRGLRLGGLARWAERWTLRRAHRVVVVSQALADQCGNDTR